MRRVAPRPGELPKAIESVLIRPTATLTDVVAACTEARDRHVASICVLPCHVAVAASTLAGTDVKVVALVSFPFGADAPAIRAAAAMTALDDGADEIEVVMALSTFLSGDVNATRDDLAAIVRQARLRHVSSGRRVPQVRAVVETSYLDDRRIRLAARVVKAADVDMAVTATGLGPRTVSTLDVELLREELGGDIAIKAAGGVRTYQEAVDLIAAGAHRVGATTIASVLDGSQPKGRR
jgi:deoxyribose-phosphate aldolase